MWGRFNCQMVVLLHLIKKQIAFPIKTVNSLQGQILGFLVLANGTNSSVKSAGEKGKGFAQASIIKHVIQANPPPLTLL